LLLSDDGVLPDGQRALSHDVFLQHQPSCDDLKHVDCRHVDFGAISAGQQPLIVEQDKSLGKGGLCVGMQLLHWENIPQKRPIHGTTRRRKLII